jgi:hypothetical protein
MWGAWFNDKVNGVNKQVVIPTPYLLDSPDISTPAGWLKLSREFVE